MPDFFYRALNGGGTVEEGWVSAVDVHDIADRLRSRGAFLISAEPRGRAKPGSDGRIEPRQLLALLEYLAASFSAGQPLLATLDDASQHVRSARLKAVVADVRAAVAENGMRLSDAMGQHPRVFPRGVIATMQAGEASGRLGFALQQLVEHLAWQDTVVSSMRQAATFPLVALGALAVLVSGLVGLVFPRLLPILQARRLPAPIPTWIVMQAAFFIRDYGALLLLAAVGFAAGVALMRRNPHGQLMLDRLLLTVPVFGRFVLAVQMERVATYLSLFYRSGVDLLQSLALVEETAGNRAVADIVAGARARIANGETMAAAFGRSPLVPAIVVQSLALGESTGRLGEALERAAVHYRREIPAEVRRMIWRVQPLMIATIGGGLLIVALGIMLPMLDLYLAIGVRP